MGEPDGEASELLYTIFLTEVRAAAAVVSSDGGQQTQNNDYGLVAVNLQAYDDQNQLRHVTLWMNPRNFYILGFTPEGSSRPYYFNDYDGATPSGGVSLMGFNGAYTALTQTAGQDRSSMQISYYDIRGSILQLANAQGNAITGVDDRRSTARSLMQLIQMVSEAARFNDMEGVYREAVGTWDIRRGLSSTLQDLENNWSNLSRFFYQLNSNPSYNVYPYITGVGNITNQQEVRRYVRVLLGSTKTSYPYSYSRDEL
ncbi:hypothetical protein GCM10010129_58060 [Streptomyces fumigatiscleroticus]|nr:hypothetical protein GCM10010129_58060 [Streptomyces fumigatiscleroticus]